MPHPVLSFFIELITAGKTAILEQIDHVEEEEGQQQGQERGLNQIAEVEDQHDKEWIRESLTEDLIIESILTRLPARTLAVCCCINKLWYNSILNDSRFSVIHYNQNKNKVFLVFNLLNVSRSGIERTYWFNLLGREKVNIKFLSGQSIRGIYELVGFCNGLACMKLAGTPTDTYGSITILNSNRSESLVLSYMRPTGGYIYVCHGFGFDSLSQVYKAVIVFASKASDELLCMVITLGTMTWRKILTSTFDILSSLGLSPFPSRMLTRVSTTLCRQATFCGGDLFWRTKNKLGGYDDKIEMLLSFDLHNEKIHFIRLPTECAQTTVTYERQYLVVDHLLEFRGYPCIARSERITRSNNDHCGHRCNYQTGVCCCCCQVHMYVLKDKEKQIWTREETFDVQIMDQEGLLPTALCRYFDTSDAVQPPTRILTFSNEVLLYWFNGERLILYNLQEKHLKVVDCNGSYPSIFQSKMNENLERYIGDDDNNIHCPSMDYQLHAQVENIVSLKTFIPKEAHTSESDSADELRQLFKNKTAAGWLSTGRKKHTYYVFS